MTFATLLRGRRLDPLNGLLHAPAYDLPHRLDDLNQLIDGFVHLYNHVRPHGALRGQTPAACLATLTANETPPSHRPCTRTRG